jgi:N utilization substance protein A
MNARLNGQLIGADLHIQKMTDFQNAMTLERQQIATAQDPSLDETLQVEGMSNLIIESLISAGFDTPRKILNATPKELAAVPEISLKMADEILEKVRKKKGLKVG